MNEAFSSLTQLLCNVVVPNLKAVQTSQAEQIAAKSGDSFVTVERILVALALATTSAAGQALKAANLTPQTLEAAIAELRGGRNADSASAENASSRIGRRIFAQQRCVKERLRRRLC